MEVTTHTSLDSAVRQFMEARIAQEAQKIADQYKEKALKDLEEAVRRAVTDTVVQFSKMINVKDGGDTLTISIADRRK